MNISICKLILGNYIRYRRVPQTRNGVTCWIEHELTYRTRFSYGILADVWRPEYVIFDYNWPTLPKVYPHR